MGLDTKEMYKLNRLISGWMIDRMVQELKFGLMEPNMKENIKQVRKMVKAFYYLLMVLDTKVVLLTMRLMVMEHINGQIKEFTLDNGEEIKCMVMDK